VSVVIEAYQSQRITVWGQVNQPGEFQLTADMTLLSALSRAGGVTAAAAREVLVIRAARKHGGQDGTPGEPEILRIDLGELQAGNMALNIPLLDGDTINVPKGQQVFVSGQVRSPGGYPAEDGMTVLQVLSLAGGLTDRGSDKRINIQRDGREANRAQGRQIDHDRPAWRHHRRRAAVLGQVMKTMIVLTIPRPPFASQPWKRSTSTITCASCINGAGSRFLPS
jgi:protein involved in polysaccharide export with SLBB domain